MRKQRARIAGDIGIVSGRRYVCDGCEIRQDHARLLGGEEVVAATTPVYVALMPELFRVGANAMGGLESSILAPLANSRWSIAVYEQDAAPDAVEVFRLGVAKP
jgi:hypothetical protein